MSEHIPYDIIVSEILHRLPVKTIGRFKCVSKEWRSFLSTRKFVKSHLSFHNHHKHPRHLVVSTPDRSNHVLAFNREDGFWSVASRPLRRDATRVFLTGGNSCHGLVSAEDIYTKRTTRVLMNAVTLERFLVSDWPLLMNYSMHSIGYDVYSDDYKIVNVGWMLNNDKCRVIDVYSVKMKRWTRIPARDGFKHIKGRGVFANGSIHWKFCALSLAGEKFEELQLPPFLSQSDLVEFDLVVLGGCIALVSPPVHCYIEIWVMKEYGVRESWTKLAIDKPDGHSYVKYEVISMLDEDEVVLKRWNEKADSFQLVTYNCTNGVWRDVVFSVYSGPRSLTTTLPIEETLVSPNHL